MKNHREESISFYLEPPCVRCEQWLCYNWTFLSFPTVKCNDSVSFSFFFVKDKLASFKLKQTVLFLKCPMCAFISLRDCNRV